jgi:hypothetical protein
VAKHSGGLAGPTGGPGDSKGDSGKEAARPVPARRITSIGAAADAGLLVLEGFLTGQVCGKDANTAARVIYAAAKATEVHHLYETARGPRVDLDSLGPVA